MMMILFIYFQREGRDGEWERNINVWETHQSVAPRKPLTGDPAYYPAWESNQQPWSLKASTQSTEPHQPGLDYCF